MMMKSAVTTSIFLNALQGIPFSQGFQVRPPVMRHSSMSRATAFMTASTATTVVEQGDVTDDHELDETSYSVRAPLKYVGPYPCLGVRFPALSTAAQRDRNESGVTLDFVLDTAANTNTINAQVAQQLSLNVTGQALPGMGSAGPIQGNLPTYYLGDMQLEGLGESIFMQNVTASALPIASPSSAGLFSLAFFQSIGGGIDFDWRGDVDAGVPPSLTFYAQDVTNATQGRCCVPITRLAVTQLPSVKVEINGHVFPALLDTGSPVTVLNAAAARESGVSTVVPDDASAAQRRNPLAALSGRFQKSQAAARGQVLTIFGAGGKRVNLVQSTDKLPVRVPTKDGDIMVDFGESHVYVGDLPGLAALQGLGVDAPPAVVLGMDVLRRNRRMFFRPLENEVWFEQRID